MSSAQRENVASINVGHIASLDSLRGLAILLVLLYHCTPGANSNLGLESLVFKIAKIGWAGVDLFFVLSGYLVCRMLLNLKEQQRPFRFFFRNRLLRIMPIYYLSLIVVLLILPLLLTQPIPVLADTFQFWLYISNNTVNKSTDFLTYNVSLGHFWSLALEMQFYLLFPTLVYLLTRAGLTKALIILWCTSVLFRTISIINGADPNITFSLSYFRSDGLILGALVATLRTSYRFTVKDFIVIAPCFIFLAWTIWASQGSAVFKSGEQYFLHRSLLPIVVCIVSAYALIYALNTRQFKGPLNFKGLHFLAKYSYGIYVYHFLFNNHLESMIMPILSTTLATQNQAAFAYFSFQLILSSFVAYISFHSIEKHLLLHKKY